MFWDLNGATGTPRRESARQSAATVILFPTWDAVPSTIRDISGRRVGHGGLLRAGFHRVSYGAIHRLLERRYHIPGETPGGLFRTATEITPGLHVRMQAAFQKYTDNAVSKTVNLPETATVDEIARIFSLTHDHGCKGITAYRYRSRPDRIFSLGCDICLIDG
jgi:hypothetical protein